jgi:sterol desaturase/sphingolipid hydroxylase (fatty acid hydroxylase superfamily)
LLQSSTERKSTFWSTLAPIRSMVFGRFCALLPLYVLGLGSPAAGSSTAVPVVVTLISTVWGFFIHANLRWRFGPLEWLISTPAFHHWHHTKTGPINRNYASTLPWLDRIFGTYYLPKEWPDCYGIDFAMRAPGDKTAALQITG